jgi:hypothetical protein
MHAQGIIEANTMQRSDQTLFISASDLVAFQACEHLSWLDWRARLNQRCVSNGMNWTNQPN